MAISIGERLPAATFLKIGAEGVVSVDLSEELAGCKAVIFGLPGAYTGTCSTAHVPSFMRTRPGFADKGVDQVICLAVNDPFVMQAWGEATGGTTAGLTFLADADGAFTKAIGMDFSVPSRGFHGRSKRYAMLVVDGVVVTHFNPEQAAGVCEISTGETLLAQI